MGTTGPGYGVIAMFLAYALVVAWARPLSLPRRTVVSAFVFVDAGLLLWLSGADTRAEIVVRDWMPAAQILFTYWLSGVVAGGGVMPRAEAWLGHWDTLLFARPFVARVTTRAPRLLLELLEGAYLSVYVVVPLGFAMVWFGAPALDADRYWTVVAAAEVLCYSTLPWIRTRPPRTTGDHVAIDGRHLRLRRLNLRILDAGSVQVNTVPSGHAAGAVATALMVSEYLLVPGLVLLGLAAAIAIASVVGRYHYAADSVLGIAVALIVWTIL